MTNAPILSVLISTYRPEGIQRVSAMALPRANGIEYVVSWQEHHDFPVPEEINQRSDIRVTRTESKGLSNNRNNALANARGEFVLIADDDVKYTHAQLQTIIDTFRNNPKTDYASFRYSGSEKKTYPDTITDLKKLPNGFYQSSIEIAFRRNLFTNGLQFCTMFGLGALFFKCGEEELLLLRARRLGLKCTFFPITITSHLHQSTGDRISDPGIIYSKGALIALSHPATFIPRVFVNAWRISKTGKLRFSTASGRMLKGAFYALSNKTIRKYALLPI